MLSSPVNHCLSPSFTYSNLIDLPTAKRNLQSMEFFGLTEYLHLSQRLFEQTKFCQLFSSCSFQSYLEQDQMNTQTIDYLKQNLTTIDLNHLHQINYDDIELYKFAKNLFFQRTCQILGIACQ
jgi:heparan sulfate 6-O-sulfotransferase HS6ST1